MSYDVDEQITVDAEASVDAEIKANTKQEKVSKATKSNTVESQAKPLTKKDIAKSIQTKYSKFDQEALSEVLTNYQGVEIISNDGVQDIENQIFSDYANVIAERKVKNALESKEKEQQEAYNQFLEKYQMSEEQASEALQKAVSFNIIGKEDFEFAKSEKGILSRQAIIENVKLLEKTKQPLPNTNIVNNTTPMDEEKYKALRGKLFTGQATVDERRLLNDEFIRRKNNK